MIRRLTFNLLISAFVLGLFYGGAVLIFEDTYYAVHTFEFAVISSIIASVALAYFYSDTTDALWSALEKDYATVKIDGNQTPMSGGLFGSSDLDDFCAAKSFANEKGVSICRVKKRGQIGECVEIPWGDIDYIDIVEPDEEFIATVVAKGSRKAASALLTAKLSLRRQRNQMTLIVPWNEQFARFAPPSIEIKKSWEWPFAVL